MKTLMLRRAILLTCASAGLLTAACADQPPTRPNIPTQAAAKAGGRQSNAWWCQYSTYPLGGDLISWEIFCVWNDDENGSVGFYNPPNQTTLDATTYCATYPETCIPDAGGGSVPNGIAPVPGLNYPPPPGSDVGRETEPDQCNASAPMISAIVANPTEYLAEYVPREGSRSTGPSATEALLTAHTDALPPLPCLDCVIRQVTEGESWDIYQVALSSGDWIYTQGGAKGGDEPTKSILSVPKRGDCTDFTWYAATVSLGAKWAHGWGQKLSTTNFQEMDAGELASHGYVEIQQSEARPGDVVVRGGHAGIYTRTDENGRVMGLANNGVPARSDGQKNIDGTTAEYDFSPNYDRSPRFFRPLVCDQ